MAYGQQIADDKHCLAYKKNFPRSQHKHQHDQDNSPPHFRVGERQPKRLPNEKKSLTTIISEYHDKNSPQSAKAED
jgi:hypothetical protein